MALCAQLVQQSKTDSWPDFWPLYMLLQYLPQRFNYRRRVKTKTLWIWTQLNPRFPHSPHSSPPPPNYSSTNCTIQVTQVHQQSKSWNLMTLIFDPVWYRVKEACSQKPNAKDLDWFKSRDRWKFRGQGWKVRSGIGNWTQCQMVEFGLYLV